MLTVLCPGKGHLQWTSCLWILLPGQQCEGPASENWPQRFLRDRRAVEGARPLTTGHTLLLSPNRKVHVTFLSTIQRQKTLILDAWHLWKQSDRWGLRASEGRGGPFRNSLNTGLPEERGCLLRPHSSAFHKAPQGSPSAIPQHTLPQSLPGG